MAKNPAEPAGSDDVRAKFREALDRKNGKGAAGSAEGSADGGNKASGATSNNKVHREFRRKSGG